MQRTCAVLALASVPAHGTENPAPPPASGDDAAQVVFSSELYPKDSRWFFAPTPEPEWRCKLSPQTPLWLTRKDPASTLLTINVDSTKIFQPVLGMGTSLEETSIYVMSKNHTDAQIRDILRTLIDPVTGMSLFRVTIGTSDFSDAHAVTSNPKGFLTG